MKRILSPRVIGYILVIIIIVTAVGCTGKEPKQENPAAGGDSQADEQVPAVEAPEYAVGESFELHGLTWTVIGSEQLPEVESMFSDTEPHQPTNGTWFVVTLDFQGQEGATGGFDTAVLKIRDGSGNLYDVAEPGGAADDYRLTHEGVKNLSMAMLGEADVQRVFAIYDVPDRAEPFTLEWMGVEDGSLVTLAKVALGE